MLNCSTQCRDVHLIPDIELCPTLKVFSDAGLLLFSPELPEGDILFRHPCLPLFITTTHSTVLHLRMILNSISLLVIRGTNEQMTNDNDLDLMGNI